jgi:uncharacterized membrane protein YoaK (UPF0700 family)
MYDGHGTGLRQMFYEKLQEKERPWTPYTMNILLYILGVIFAENVQKNFPHWTGDFEFYDFM